MSRITTVEAKITFHLLTFQFPRRLELFFHPLVWNFLQLVPKYVGIATVPHNVPEPVAKLVSNTCEPNTKF